MIPLPYYASTLNQMRGHKIPQSDINFSSEVYYYIWRSLYQRFVSKFDLGVPDHWDKDIYTFTILAMGFVGVFDTNKYALSIEDRFGIIPAPATLSGIGVQMQPTKIRTANPYFTMPESEVIYEGAGLIKITGDYRGILDIVDFYAERLALLVASIDQSIINSKYAYIVGANSEAGAATLKAIFDARNSGKPLIVFDKDKLKKKDAIDKTSPLTNEEPFNFIDLDVGRNYITDKLIQDYRSIMNQFDTEIGIANIQYEKKERLVTNEIESNNVESVARFNYFLDHLQLSIEKTIEVFPVLEGQLYAKATVYDTGQTGAKEAKGGDSDVIEADSGRTSRLRNIFKR